MIPTTVKVRLVAKSGQTTSFLARCPVPEDFLLPDYDGTMIYYKRLFAVLKCSDPIEVKVVIYREAKFEPTF